MSQLPDELNNDLRAILGRPCFTCGHFAAGLRALGHVIERRAEAEQAAVIFWLLQCYLQHGAKWLEQAERDRVRMVEALESQS